MAFEFEADEGLEEAIRVLRSGGKLAILFWSTPHEIKETRSWLKSLPIKNVRLRS